MKILYIITKSEAGGAQTHVSQLGQYFKTQGHEVAILSYPGGWLQDEAEKLGIEFFSNEYFSNSLNPAKVIKAFLKTKQIINEFNPNLVHCHSSAAGVYGRMAVRNKIRTLYTAHGWGFNLGVPFWQKYLAIIFEKLLSRYCVKIICVSQFVKDLALKYKIAPVAKLEVILNGMELLPEKLISKESNIKLIFVGRLADPKDPLLLLQAVKENKFSVQVNIVGSGPKLGELIQYVKNNKLDNINLLGELSREKTLELLKLSEIFVLISKWEGLPLTILEAMSVGLPVIASNVGGISEAVSSENGILIDNKVIELREAIKKIMDDQELRIKMGNSGRKKIETIFSLEKMLHKINEVYLNRL